MLLCIGIINGVDAQGKFGYIDFDRTLHEMNEYKIADIVYKDIVAGYEAEIERNDKEFYRQYVEFLHSQGHLSNTILLKRQKELQQLSDNSLEFKKKQKELLAADRDSLMAPVKEKLDKAIKDVADILKLDYVIDSSAKGFLYIGENGVDITKQVYGILTIPFVEENTEENAEEEKQETENAEKEKEEQKTEG